MEATTERTATILVVDDEPGIRLLVKNILEYSGFKVEAAASGTEALGIFRKQPSAIHLLISDILMPGITGVQLAEEVRKVRPALPVLFMSGYSAEFDGEMHGFEVIQKPFKPAELVSRAASALSDSGTCEG